MRKYQVAFIIIVSLITQQSFADVSATSMPSATMTSSDDASIKQCKTIVNACLTAGYVRKGSQGKAFWHDCMKPVLLGQTVAGVSVDAADATACRQFKITKMQKELEQLQKVSNTQTN